VPAQPTAESGLNWPVSVGAVVHARLVQVHDRWWPTGGREAPSKVAALGGHRRAVEEGDGGGVLAAVLAVVAGGEVLHLEGGDEGVSPGLKQRRKMSSGASHPGQRKLAQRGGVRQRRWNFGGLR
jgi:hypothetical protein